MTETTAAHHTCDAPACSDAVLTRATAIFKQLSNESRLRLLLHLEATPATVTELATTLGQSQPLVSQQLRTLREAGLVAGEKHGKTVTYRLADEHVSHIIRDTLQHVAEPDPLP